MAGNHKKHNTQRGAVSIMELMVAFFIFAIVVLIATGVFVNALAGQRKTQSQQDSLENVRYAMEALAKEIRMSKNPIINADGNLEVDAVKVGNKVISPVTYKLNNQGQIERFGEALTADNVEILDLDFILNDMANHHPQITILMKAKVEGAKPGEGSEINLQTTVSLRSYSS